MDKHIIKIREFIAKDKLDKSLDEFKETALSIDQNATLLNLKGRNSNLKELMSAGTLDYKELLINKNQLRQDIISFLDIYQFLPIPHEENQVQKNVQEDKIDIPQVGLLLEELFKNDICKAISQKEFLKNDNAFFQKLVAHFIEKGDTHILSSKAKLCDSLYNDFIKKPHVFFQSIKNCLQHKTGDCTLFNILNNVIKEHTDNYELSEPQKVFSTLLITSKCVVFAQNSLDGVSKLSNDFIKSFNEILSKIFKIPNFTIAEFKQLLFNETKGMSSKIRSKKAQLMRMLDDKLGNLKHKIKAIFKILEWDAANSNKKNKLILDDFDCLLKTRISKAKQDFFILKNEELMTEIENKVLLNFHSLIVELRATIEPVNSVNDFKENFSFLKETRLHGEYNYYILNLITGLAQFWLIQPDNNFLGKWFD